MAVLVSAPFARNKGRQVKSCESVQKTVSKYTAEPTLYFQHFTFSVLRWQLRFLTVFGQETLHDFFVSFIPRRVNYFDIEVFSHFHSKSFLLFSRNKCTQKFRILFEISIGKFIQGS